MNYSPYCRPKGVAGKGAEGRWARVHHFEHRVLKQPPTDEGWGRADISPSEIGGWNQERLGSCLCEGAATFRQRHAVVRQVPPQMLLVVSLNTLGRAAARKRSNGTQRPNLWGQVKARRPAGKQKLRVGMGVGARGQAWERWDWAWV